MDISLRGYLCGNDDADILRFWGWRDITAPMDIEKGLREANGGDVTLLVNSPGGSMAVGTEIFSVIKRYPGNVDALVQSMAASSATLAISSCRAIRSEPGALFCYHNPSYDADGDWLVHQKAAEELRSAAEAILNIYVLRSGKSREELAELMDADRLISPQQALEYGLIDEVVGLAEEAEPGPIQLVAGSGLVPRVSARMRRTYLEHMAAEAAGRDSAMRATAYARALAEF